MSDTPTPRTNKHLEGLRQNPELSGCNRTLDFARGLERELAEQVLCNGKGAEREADLLGKVERLERETLHFLCLATNAEFNASKTARELIKAKETIKNDSDSWAHDHTRLQNLCREVGFSERDVEGDRFGIPAITDLGDMLRSKVAELERENERLREAVLKFSAVAVNIIRRRTFLLPPESEMFEAACGELTLILTNPTKR